MLKLTTIDDDGYIESTLTTIFKKTFMFFLYSHNLKSKSENSINVSLVQNIIWLSLCV
jgi:hypothetical protein